MKFETLRNRLAGRFTLVRHVQLEFFHLLRRLGLSKALHLVTGVCHLEELISGGDAVEVPLRREMDPQAGAGQVPGSASMNACRRLYRLDGGYCLIAGGYFERAILDRNRRLVAELSPDTYSPGRHRALRQIPCRIDTGHGILYSLVTPGARENYYHWMIDLMPKFSLIPGLQEQGRGGVEPTVVLINHEYQPYQVECLRILGLDVMAIQAKSATLYGGRSLFVPEDTPFRTEDARFLQSLFLEGVSRQQSSGDRRIYVVRGCTRRRRIRNETAVMASLQRLGFSCYDAAGESVARQASEFARAAMVVGFHGAGLTNVVFCKPGTRLVEVCDTTYAPDYYRRLAGELNLRYSRLLDCTMPIAQGGIAEDLTVDIARLESDLRCVMQSHSSS